MEELVIHHKTPVVLRRFISVIMFLNGIIWIVGHLDSLKFHHWFFGITFILLGIAYFTNGFGSDKTFIHPHEGAIKVKWINWLRPVIINDNTIESITLSKFKVLIIIKGRKPLKLNMDFLEREEKKNVYEYFIEYARSRNLELIRDF
jgi:hypothetical protein